MAAKDKKNGKYYEVTKERRASTWEITLSVGAIGATLGFFTALLAGACSQSATLDSIVVVSLLATILGFGIGLLVSWVFQRCFGNLLDQVTKPVSSTSETVPENDGMQTSTPEPAPAETEEKGQSVDYVFPEFSPDQR
jgi:phosphate/sulfate permease